MWHVAAGTLTGPHHRAAGTPNQDAFGHRSVGDLFLGAVADGAGSLPLSHEGAALAVETALDFMESHRGNDVPLQALVFGGVEAARLAVRDRVNFKDYGCTLSLVAISQDAWAIACVGDSFVVTSHDDGTHVFHTGEPLGEYANVTRLLTSDTLGTTYEFGQEPLSGIFLGSDGLLPLAVVADEAHTPFWNPILKRVQDKNLDVEGLLSHMDAQERILDDTTLLAAVRST